MPSLLGDAGVAVGSHAHIDLADALEKLCPEEQAIILLSYFAGWSDRRIGEDMGFPRSTVQNRRARALTRLADILTEGGDPHGKDKD